MINFARCAAWAAHLLFLLDLNTNNQPMKSINYNHLLPLLTFYFLLFIFRPCFSQSNMPIQWQGCYGGTDYDYATDIVEHENGYLIIGQVASDDGDITNYHGGWYDIWLMQIDSVGNLLWERCYGGSGPEYQGMIISDNEESYYFCGAVGSNDGDVQSGNHGMYDIWVVKIDGAGEIIWEKCFGGSGLEEFPNIKLLGNGNILVSSHSTSSDGNLPAHYGYRDAWIFVLSPEGEILKNAVFGNDLHNGVSDAIETQDGGIFFTSDASSTEGMVEGTYHGGQADVWVVKLDSSMNIEWQKLYGGGETDYGGFGLLELEDGYIFLAQTNSNDGDVSGLNQQIGEYTDIWAVKIDFEGNIIWQRCLGGESWDFAGSLHQTDDGGFMIFAETKSYGGDVSGNNSWSAFYDIWMAKLSANGELVWQECFGGYGNERTLSGSLRKSDHNWVIAGRASYENSFDVDCDLHGSPEDFWVFEIKDTTVSIDEMESETLKVYPNPAKDWVVFELPSGAPPSIPPGGGKNPSLQITNIFGQEVARIALWQEVTVWDCREVEAGVYFYQLKTKDQQLKGKIIIK